VSAFTGICKHPFNVVITLWSVLIWQATEYCIGKQEYFNFQFLAVFFFKLPYTYRSIWLFEQDQMGLAPGLTAIYGWTGE
jgi:hypothetical protein